MTGQSEPETGERYVKIARRWFAEGWAGNLARAEDIFKQVGYLPDSVRAAGAAARFRKEHHGSSS